MPKRAASKSAATPKGQKVNVPMDRRLQLALAAGYEVWALAEEIRPYVLRMVRAETGNEEAVIFTLLDRLEVIGDELTDVADFDEDHAHNAKELGARLRMVP